MKTHRPDWIDVGHDGSDAWASLARNIGMEEIKRAARAGHCVVVGCRKRVPRHDPICHAHWSELVAPKGLVILNSMPIPASRWTDRMRHIAGYTSLICARLIGHPTQVGFVNEHHLHASAMFGAKDRDRHIVLNIASREPWADWCAGRRKGTIGSSRWRALRMLRNLHDVIIHEVSHEHGEHEDDDFIYALSWYGALLAQDAVEAPIGMLAFVDGLMVPPKRGRARSFLRQRATLLRLRLAHVEKALQAHATSS